MNQATWDGVMDVLKSIEDYLVKQDATQERAKIQKVPKIGENQANQPLIGGESPNGKVGTGVAKSLRKSYPEDEGSRTFNPDEEIDSEGDSFLKEEEDLEAGLDEGGYDDEDDYDEDEEDDYDEDEEDMYDEDEEVGVGDEDEAELKSLLKDIRASLIEKSRHSTANLSKSITAELRKSIQPMIRDETQRMMRKMGYRPSRPDVIRYGLDGIDQGNNTIHKSVSRDTRERDLANTIDDLSSQSWQKLGQTREHMGLFNPFR